LSDGGRRDRTKIAEHGKRNAGEKIAQALLIGINGNFV